MWNCAPFLVAVGSFATYVLIDPENNILDSRFLKPFSRELYDYNHNME